MITLADRHSASIPSATPAAYSVPDIKVLMFTFKVLYSLGPEYLCDHLSPYEPRTALASVNQLATLP